MNHQGFSWPAPSPWLTRICGYLLLLAMALAVAARLFSPIPAWLAGIPLWLSILLLAPNIKPTQRKQIGLLVSIGLAGLMFSSLGPVGAHHTAVNWLKALEGNQLVVSLLIGVSFLRLVALSGIAPGESLPAGKRVLNQTLWGTHLFTSVLNISAIFIVGDRLAHARKNQPISTLQGMILLRAFSTCAFWSPFFAAMGLTLLSAPGSNLATLILFGLPVAVFGLAFSTWEIGRRPEALETTGYPMNFSALWMPALLATGVLLAHLIWPDVTVLVLVTLLALLFSVGWLVLMKRQTGVRTVLQHIREGLPNLCSEIALFLAAAVLAAGVTATLNAFELSVAPAHFGALEACITLAALIAAAMAGMHPVTSVVLAGSLLAPSVTDPNLLGLTMLMGWSLGVGLSPLSGIQLMLQARLGMSAKAMLKANRFYGPTLFLICCLTLYLYEWLM